MQKPKILTIIGFVTIFSIIGYYKKSSTTNNLFTELNSSQNQFQTVQEKKEHEINTLLKKIFPHHANAWLDLLRATKLLPQLTESISNYSLEETENIHDIFLVESLNTLLQEGWLRKSNLEPWHLSDNILSVEKKKHITEALSEMHIYDEIYPTKIDRQYRQYDCALLMGSSEPAVRIRLNYLLDLWKDGLRFDRLFVVTGYRQLEPELEPVTATLAALKIDTTEEQMTRYVLTTTLIEKAKTDPAFQNFDQKVKIIYTNAFKKPQNARATANDTLMQWKNLYGATHKTILMVSNQPYTEYHTAVFAGILSHDFADPIEMLGTTRTHFKLTNGIEVETIGDKCVNQKIMVTLDNLARVFYQYLPLFKKELNAKS